MQLFATERGAQCVSCRSSYDSIGGVLDLRVPEATAFDCRADSERARRIVSEMSGRSAADLIRRIFSPGDEWDEEWARSRQRAILNSIEPLRREIKGWLSRCAPADSVFLDLGCGVGNLIAAAALEGRKAIGIDASLTLLLIARQLVREHGSEPVLAAGLAECIPLPDQSVPGVISMDVVEHVDDLKRYFREINRVMRGGGCAAFSTPNRFSLTAEPHVGVWGVGWLPRLLQKSYVKWRSGKRYESTRLMSSWEAVRLARRYAGFDVAILIPQVTDENIATFPPRRAALARLYNRLASMPGTKWVFRLVGPFFHILAVKARVPRAH